MNDSPVIDPPAPATPEAGCFASPPRLDEVQNLWTAFQQHLLRGQVDPGGEHAGQYVAFNGDRVAEYGPDPVALRARVADALGIHPERLVIAYLDA